jgi:hypothetical protein
LLVVLCSLASVPVYGLDDQSEIWKKEREELLSTKTTLETSLKDTLAQKKDLEKQFNRLALDEQEYTTKVNSANSYCKGTVEDAEYEKRKGWCEEEQHRLDTVREHLIKQRRHSDELNRRQIEELSRLRPPYERVLRALACIDVAQQAERDRTQIKQQRKTTEASQEELNEWTQLNTDAQKQAVAASANFVLGKFVSNVDTVRGSVSKLDHHAKFLASKATQSRKYQTRMKYLAELDAALAKLEPMQGNLMDKVVVNAGLETEKAWGLARDTMHHEFRVAAKHNESMNEVLNDPEFKKAFIGEDSDTPGLEVLSALTEQAIEDVGKMQLGLIEAEKLTGPTVLAAVFVRDALYSALQSLLSTERVQQQSDLAGELAKAAGSLQKQYKKSVDALHACQESARIS